MKLKVKLSIFMIAVMVFVVLGISTTLLNRSSALTVGLNREALDYYGYAQAMYLQGMENENITILRTVASVMSDYENIPAEQRRDEYERLLMAVLAQNERFVTIYTVWKPNAVDGRDSRFIGRLGSSPTGQFAAEYTRENERIEMRTSADLKSSMEYFNGTDSKKDRVSSPEAGTIGARNIYVINFMVPIINPRTNETVGAVGGYVDIAGIQTAVENTMYDYFIADLMAVYDDSGFILANAVPDRVGKNMRDAEAMLYGDFLEDAFQAVAGGWQGQYFCYSQILDTMVQIRLTPFKIGNSDKTWTVMIAATEDYMLLEVRQMTQFTIMLAVILIITAAVIIFVVVNKLTRQSSI